MAPGLDLGLRSELATRGLRTRPSLQWRAGAGPSDHGHWLLDGAPMTLPMASDSPWAVDDEGALTRAGVVVDAGIAAVARPRFYELQTDDGVPLPIVPS